MTLRREIGQRRLALEARADAERAALLSAAAPLARRLGALERFLRLAAWAARAALTARYLLRRG